MFVLNRHRYYYLSSVQLAEYWREQGNPTEEHYSSGGHCNVWSNIDIINCIDNGVGNLFSLHPDPTTTTTTEPICTNIPPGSVVDDPLCVVVAILRPVLSGVRRYGWGTGSVVKSLMAACALVISLCASACAALRTVLL